MQLIEKIDISPKNYIEVYEEDDYKYVLTYDEPVTHVQAMPKYPYRPTVSMIDGGNASISFETGPFSEEVIDEHISRLESTKHIVKRMRYAFFSGGNAAKK